MVDKAQESSADLRPAETGSSSSIEQSEADGSKSVLQVIEASGCVSDAVSEPDIGRSPETEEESDTEVDHSVEVLSEGIDEDQSEETLVEGVDDEGAPPGSTGNEAGNDGENAEDIPYSSYPESQYFRCLDEELLPNSSIPINLSHAENLDVSAKPDMDWELHEKAGSPQAEIRVCRSADDSRVVMVWQAYEDIKTVFPEESTWADPPRPEGSWPYVITPIPGKGNGMIATRDIKRGETVLVERPILMFPIQAASWEEMEKDYEEMAQHLDQEDQQVVRELRNCGVHHDRSNLLGMLFTNVMKCTFLQGNYCQGYSGLSVDGCRANHSCNPNLLYEFDCETVLMEYRAARDVKEGEELCNSYIDTSMNFAERQKYLKGSYDFTCNCKGCSLASESEIQASDGRRTKIRDECFAAPGNWRKWLAISMPSTTEIIDMYRELLSDIEEEGMDPYRPIPIRWLAYTYAALGNEEEFKKWCKEAVGCIRTLGTPGKGFLDDAIWKEWLEEPKSVPFWGFRQGNKWA